MILAAIVYIVFFLLMSGSALSRDVKKEPWSFEQLARSVCLIAGLVLSIMTIV